MRPPQMPRRTATVRSETPTRPAPQERSSATRPAPASRPSPPEPRPVVPRPSPPRPAVPSVPVPSPRPPSEARTSPARPSSALERLAPAPRPTVLATAERFAERTRLRRRLTRRRVAWWAAGLVAAATVGWVTFFSPVLALDVAEVQVAGEGTVVDTSSVLAVVAGYDGTPLPRLDTVELRRAVLDVPGVRAAEVARDWPHALRITLVSREPVAAVPVPAGDAEETAGDVAGAGEPDGSAPGTQQSTDDAAAQGGYLLLDVEGVQVGRSAEPPAGLPVVSVPADDEDARAMTAVLAVLESLPPELADQVTAAGAASEDTVSLTLADGARVEWGSAEQSALKARVVLTLRSAPASAGASVFDVAAPTMPITHS